MGSRPEKNNNTIILETTDDYSATLRKMVNILSDQGYGIQTIDKELGILTTTEKGFKAGTISLNLQVREGENTKIIIRGVIDGTDMTIWGATADGKGNVEFRGMQGSPMMLAWEEMERVAKAYPEANITFTTN